MRFTAATTAALSLAGMSQAVATPPEYTRAIITVEASHGGAGSDLTNQTIFVPLNRIYTDDSHHALSAVSTLYLDTVIGGQVPVEDISCTPYKSTNGTGTHGNTFSYEKPSLLSTNTVTVGSIVCKASKN